ncbi:MAG: efflux RND transporter periplasmic adaptor subunit, partial [Odoribacter splanchnicus]
SFNRDVYNIYPGFSCKVILSIDNETGKGYTVPLSAVFKDLKTDETSVWLYHTADETVKRQKVTTEQLLGTDRVLVTEGLEADDVIVVAGVNYIVNGQKVAVIEN